MHGQTVTFLSVVNTNSSCTECDDLQPGGLDAPNGLTCKSGWNTTPSLYWATGAFCQTFVNSNNTSQTSFTWSNGVWGTTADNGYTKHLRWYY